MCLTRKVYQHCQNMTYYKSTEICVYNDVFIIFLSNIMVAYTQQYTPKISEI